MDIASVIIRILKLRSNQKVGLNNILGSFDSIKIVVVVTIIPEALIYLSVNPGKISIIWMLHTYMSEE